MKLSFIFDKSEEVNSDQDNLQEVSESALNSNVSRSGPIPQTKSINSMGSQVNFCYIDQFPVRKVKLCTEEKKQHWRKYQIELKYHQKKQRKKALSFGVYFWIKLQAANLKLSEAATRDVLSKNVLLKI